MNFDCIKAYDVRGTVPEQLNGDVATRIAWALVNMLAPKNCVIGWDVRSHSPMIVEALTTALSTNGVEVVQLGLAGTEEVYFWAGEYDMDLGLMVTASHNPAEYNGIKIVQRGAVPMIGETSMQRVREVAMHTTSAPCPRATAAPIRQQTDKSAYIQKLLSLVDIGHLKPLKLAINSGNGVSGPVVEALRPHLPFDISHVHPNPDGTFPNGIPNPLIVEKRSDTINAVAQVGADMGIAFDGDFDRCFFFDENGRYIEGYYVVGMMAQALLSKQPGESVCYDPRLVWNTEDVLQAMGGKAVMTQSGHTFMKAGMRASNAIYGGEMSAHHYFRDFYFCDSGMLPWLLVAQLLSTSGKRLSELVDEMIAAYPCSGEVNFRLPNQEAQQLTIAKIKSHYLAKASDVDDLDGLSMSFEDEGWRFNLRQSNTEPLLRLNIEARGDAKLVDKHLIAMKALIEN